MNTHCGSNGTKREGWLSMTNEKAINLLRRIQEPEAYEPQITEEAFEALEMAIRALGTGTNVGELISKQATLDALNHELRCGAVINQCGLEMAYEIIEGLLAAEPKRETSTVSVGKSKGGVTMWYECAVCGEPVDQGDTFCSGCGRRLIHE